MEDKNTNLDPILELTKIMRNFEQRLIKNEQLVLHTFSYLYSRCDENQLDYTYIHKDIGDLFTQYSYLSNEIDGLKLQLPEKIVHVNTEQKQSKPKRRRPWHYFISKHFRYRTLLKLKGQIEEEIRLKNQEKQRLLEEQKAKELEEQRRRDAERLKWLEEQNRQEEQRKQDRRRKAKAEMNKILNNLK